MQEAQNHVVPEPEGVHQLPHLFLTTYAMPNVDREFRIVLPGIDSEGNSLPLPVYPVRD